jgi:hypothetical protein
MRPTAVAAALFLAAAALFAVGPGATTRAASPEAGSGLILVIEPGSPSPNSVTTCPYEPTVVGKWAGLS